jgi:hypothetical protein
LKKQISLFAVLIVLDRELNDRAVYLWSDADEIGKYLRIIRAWVLVSAADHQSSRDQGSGDNGNTDNPAETPALRICVVVGHRLSFRTN